MSYFKKYLTEKINKQEINQILDDSDFRVGAEFEFYMLDLPSTYFDEEAYSDAKNEYNIYMKKLDEYLVLSKEHTKWENKVYHYEKVLKTNNYKKAKEQLEILMDNEPTKYHPPVPPLYLGYFGRDKYIGLPIPEPDKEHFQETMPFDKIRDLVHDDIRTSPEMKGIYTNNWEIHEDGSLDSDYDGRGVEIVSPPLHIKEFMKACQAMFEYIKNHGYTDDKCGFHIGVSLKTGMGDVDVVKLILFTDEEYIYKFFDSRKGNTYARSVRNNVLKSIAYLNKNSEDENDKAENIKIFKTLLDTDRLHVPFSSDHFHGINIEHLESKDPYIEFRFIGGSGYEKKWDNIKVIIAHYMYNLKLARDPNFKRKEYVSKVSRLLHKIEAFIVGKELQRLRNEYDDIDKNMKTIKELERRMSSLPKLSSLEDSALRDSFWHW